MLSKNLRFLLICLLLVFIVSSKNVYAVEKTSTFNSSFNTKVTQNTLQNVGLSVLPNNAWLNYNFTGEFLWANASVYNVADVDSWQAASSLLANFDPSTGNPPPNTNNQFAFLDDSYANVIGLGSDFEKPNEARFFYRAKYQLPDDARQIKSAHLYVASDNLANVWVNGNPVGPELSGSAVNYGCPGTFQDRWLTANVKGGVSYFDVTSVFNINTKNYLLAFNVMNAFPCGEPHPSGLQYYLVVKYDTEASGINQPPICTLDPVIKDPSKDFYSPFEVINFIPRAYDPEGQNIVITNWFTENNGGVFSDLSNLNSVYYRSPPTGGVTDTISYIASDGQLTTTCSFDIQTKTSFSCIGQQCYLNSQGNYNDYTSCMFDCNANFDSKFTCNADYQCVASDSGEYLNQTQCNEDCVPPAGDVACSEVKYTDNGDTLTLSALVNNFSDTEVPYSWNSSYSNSSFEVPSDNFECTNAQSCLMKLLNTSYTTPQVDYTKPPQGQTDTITMRVNGNTSDLCTIYICENGEVCDNNNLSKNLEMAFDKSTYTLDAKTSTLANLSFTTKNFNDDDYYTINLSCAGSNVDCTFVSNNSEVYVASVDDLKKGLDVSIASTGDVSSVSTLTASGYLSEGVLERSTSAQVLINALNTVSYRFLDVDSNTQSIANGKNYHCENNTPLPSYTSGQLRVSLDKVSFDSFESVFNGPSTSINDNSVATKLKNSLYLFSTDDSLLQKNVANPMEVYCVRSETDSGEVRTGPSRIGFDLNEFNNSATVTVVVGPKLSEGWFSAFGGNAYALGDFISDVPVGKRIMQGYDSIMQGFAAVSGMLGYGDFHGLDNARKPLKYIENYTRIDSMDLFKSKFEKSLGVNPYSIDSLGNIPTSSTITNFYYHEGDFTIDTNFTVDPNSAVPVLYVKSHETKGAGNVTILEDVDNLDLVLVADGNVTIEANKEECVPLENQSKTDKADYMFHVFRSTGSGDWVDRGGIYELVNPNWTRTIWRSTVPGLADTQDGGSNIPGPNYFEFTKPAEFTYAKVQPIWVQSGEVIQQNEYIRFEADLGNGVQTANCPDFDGNSDPKNPNTHTSSTGYEIPGFPDNIHKQYLCPETIIGNVESIGNLIITPSFPDDQLGSSCFSETNNSWDKLKCNGSSVAGVEVTWYKYDPTNIPPEQCTTDKNLIVRGGIISKSTVDGGIIIGSSRLDEVYDDPTEEFYFRPEIYFSDDSSSNFFKENNIFLRKLD